MSKTVKVNVTKDKEGNESFGIYVRRKFLGFFPYWVKVRDFYEYGEVEEFANSIKEFPKYY